MGSAAAEITPILTAEDCDRELLREGVPCHAPDGGVYLEYADKYARDAGESGRAGPDRVD